jgi:CRP/FNR family transcriptional regulator, cyclic AMP receptor protein
LARKEKRHTFDANLFLATVGRGRTLINYRKDEVVFSQGHPADSVFYIRKGKIKLVIASKQGKQAVVAILGAGEFFGEGCLNGQVLRLATARAMTESEVMRLQKTEMLHALHAELAFAEMFMAHLLTRNSRVEEDLVDQLFNSSEKRLARTLLQLANFGNNDTPQQIPQFSQEMLAGIIGTTRPRVSFFMNKFRKLGFIDYHDGLKGLKINNSLLSVVLHS